MNQSAISSMNQKEIWEALSKAASRLKVSECWIVCYEVDGAKSSFFVPDPGHSWEA
ncbi:MAG: hypothetical protein JNM63_15635 [Spirochaetia bacterium]|nr:hypothetical protein [Spirochaetia bacterium]